MCLPCAMTESIVAFLRLQFMGKMDMWVGAMMETHR